MSDSPKATGKANAEHLELRAAPRPVTRLNRRTLALVAGILASALLGATVWSLQVQHRSPQSGPELHVSEKVAHADQLDKIAVDYTQVPPLGDPRPGDWGAVQAKQEARQDNPSIGASQTGKRAANSTRERTQEIDPISSAPLMFKTNTSNTGKLSEQSVDATASTTPQQSAFAALPTNTPTDPTEVQNQQNHKQLFLTEIGNTATRGSGTLQPPPSPYAVMAGTVISAALVTGIKSDLPGQIIANVTEPIYDALTGRTLLIPQGSRLLGSYDSQIAFGQRRVLVVWTRLIMPDTSSITLDRLPGVDSDGYAGLEDNVDWHWGRIFAGATVSTLIGVGAELAAPDRNSGDGRVVVATRNSVQDSVNQIGQEITKRNLNIQPTLTERPGLPLRVIVNKDLILRPYQPLFYGRSTP